MLVKNELEHIYQQARTAKRIPDSVIADSSGNFASEIVKQKNSALSLCLKAIMNNSKLDDSLSSPSRAQLISIRDFVSAARGLNIRYGHDIESNLDAIDTEVKDLLDNLQVDERGGHEAEAMLPLVKIMNNAWKPWAAAVAGGLLFCAGAQFEKWKSESHKDRELDHSSEEAAKNTWAKREELPKAEKHQTADSERNPGER